MLTRYCCQGYVLIEYSTLDESKAAIEALNGEKLLEQTIGVDFAFVRPPPSKGQSGGRSGRKGGKARSRSPGVKRREDDDEEDSKE